jgi:hypothetical protein
VRLPKSENALAFRFICWKLGYSVTAIEQLWTGDCFSVVSYREYGVQMGEDIRDLGVDPHELH